MGGSTNSTTKKGYKQAEIVTALNATGGMVYLAAEKLGCHPDTIYKRARKEQAIADAIEQARGRFLDIAESALKRAVLKGEAWAVCFALKTVGKQRGYTERFEFEVFDAKQRAETAIEEFISRTKKSRSEAIEFLKPHIPQISELVH